MRAGTSLRRVEEGNEVKQQVRLLPECPPQAKVAIIDDDVEVGDTASPQQRQELLKLLNMGRDCCASNLSELWSACLPQIDIVLKDGRRPAARSRLQQLRQNVIPFEKKTY